MLDSNTPAQRIDYVKMHGIGNDYVFVSSLDEPLGIQHNALGHLARMISDRHRGVGSDGLILISQPTDNDAHVRMQIWNADGSNAEFCGNGLRCVARLCRERFCISDTILNIQTGAGVLRVRTDVAHSNDEPSAPNTFFACVDVGEPRFGTDAFLIDRSHVEAFDNCELHIRNVGPVPDIACIPVSVGNPHAILIVDDLDRVHAEPFEWIGPVMEIHPAFPEHVNVHAIKLVDRSHIKMQSWERGVGLTRSCGSGACAAVVAARLLDLCEPHVRVDLPGGKLDIRWDGPDSRSDTDSHVTMTGPASYICAGHVLVSDAGELVDVDPAHAAFLPA